MQLIVLGSVLVFDDVHIVAVDLRGTNDSVKRKGVVLLLMVICVCVSN